MVEWTTRTTTTKSSLVFPLFDAKKRIGSHHRGQKRKTTTTTLMAATNTPTTKTTTTKTTIIGTHDGSFHCDEALGCYLLRQTRAFLDAQIVRSRDAVRWIIAVVIDVQGGIRRRKASLRPPPKRVRGDARDWPVHQNEAQLRRTSVQALRERNRGEEDRQERGRSIDHVAVSEDVRGTPSKRWTASITGWRNLKS